MVNSKNNRPHARICVHALYQPIARQQTSHALSSAACSLVEPCQHRQQWKLLCAIYGQTEPGLAQLSSAQPRKDASITAAEKTDAPLMPFR